MKKWVEKLIQQFDFDWKGASDDASPDSKISEDRATLLFIIDLYNKHLLELEKHPVRKVRETLDEFARELIAPPHGDSERVLFRFRQFFSGYRIDECAYHQKTFEDFRTIIWDFVDQLSEDISKEQKEDMEVRRSLEDLKEAVESNSIDLLKNNSRRFIDCYVEKQFKKEKRTSTKMKTIRKNLNVVKKQLVEAKDSARLDHLTQALNRKSFDEYCLQHQKLFQISQQPVSMIVVDIDYFKRINDTYGHAVGDFVLKELVKTMRELFPRESDLICRIGGEEFAILLPDFKIEHAIKKAEEVLAHTRAETYVHENHQIRFTVSMGIAQLTDGETVEAWLKRADEALYKSKSNGRNRYTLASHLKEAA